MRVALMVVCAGLALADCGRGKPSAEELANFKPADPALATLYDHSCKACHAVADSGAPPVHDHDAWEPRWQKGLPTLVSHAITGFQAMPAGGQCSACTREDYEKLIRFMADEENKQ
ncbi:MAG TPA: c-type cytochrome [Rhizomicrobium sp.]|nr:c-type cytochrome [Rhizomicrobium sp.]